MGIPPHHLYKCPPPELLEDVQRSAVLHMPPCPGMDRSCQQKSINQSACPSHRRSECPAAGLMNRFSGLWKNPALVKHRKKFRLHAGYEQNTPDQESVQSIPLRG